MSPLLLLISALLCSLSAHATGSDPASSGWSRSLWSFTEGVTHATVDGSPDLGAGVGFSWSALTRHTPGSERGFYLRRSGMLTLSTDFILPLPDHWEVTYGGGLTAVRRVRPGGPVRAQGFGGLAVERDGSRPDALLDLGVRLTVDSPGTIAEWVRARPALLVWGIGVESFVCVGRSERSLNGGVVLTVRRRERGAPEGRPGGTPEPAPGGSGPAEGV